MSIFRKDKAEGNVSNSSSFESGDVSSQLKKIMDHLMFLEKKIDSIIEQGKNRRPSFNQGFGGGYARPRPNYPSGGNNRGNYGSRPSGGPGGPGPTRYQPNRYSSNRPPRHGQPNRQPNAQPSQG